jgi:hypothetical protein
MTSVTNVFFAFCTKDEDFIYPICPDHTRACLTFEKSRNDIFYAQKGIYDPTQAAKYTFVYPTLYFADDIEWRPYRPFIDRLLGLNSKKVENTLHVKNGKRKIEIQEGCAVVFNKETGLFMAATEGMQGPIEKDINYTNWKNYITQTQDTEIRDAGQVLHYCQGKNDITQRSFENLKKILKEKDYGPELLKVIRRHDYEKHQPSEHSVRLN